VQSPEESGDRGADDPRRDRRVHGVFGPGPNRGRMAA
jgi:hypothetical protein